MGVPQLSPNLLPFSYSVLVLSQASLRADLEEEIAGHRKEGSGTAPRPGLQRDKESETRTNAPGPGRAKGACSAPSFPPSVA